MTTEYTRLHSVVNVHPRNRGITVQIHMKLTGGNPRWPLPTVSRSGSVVRRSPPLIAFGSARWCIPAPVACIHREWIDRLHMWAEGKYWASEGSQIRRSPCPCPGSEITTGHGVGPCEQANSFAQPRLAPAITVCVPTGAIRVSMPNFGLHRR